MVRRDPRVRILAAAAVALAHVYVLEILLAQRMPVVRVPLTAGNVLVLLVPRDEEPAPPAISPDIPAARPAVAVTLQLPEIDSSAFPEQPSPDWFQAGELAAASFGAADGIGVREFGAIGRRAPEPRKAKPFGWDKSRTERVTAMPAGGIAVQMGSNCTLILAPLPMLGCALGKIPARGDLFDEMSAPAVPRDWQDSAALPLKK